MHNRMNVVEVAPAMSVARDSIGEHRLRKDGGSLSTRRPATLPPARWSKMLENKYGIEGHETHLCLKYGRHERKFLDPQQLSARLINSEQPCRRPNRFD
jgi:hypothetical protein